MDASLGFVSSFLTPGVANARASSFVQRTHVQRQIAPTGRAVVKAVATNEVIKKKLHKNEGLKADSKQLRFPLKEELANQEIFISENAVQIMKFHGSYQQDDRELRAPGKQKAYQFMLRLKMPAGEMPAGMYQVLDQLSEKYGNHTLRATTRCAWQMHGILKGDLKTVFSTIMNAGGSTVGACGDINRNIVATPAPIMTKPYIYARHYAKVLAEILAPQSGAFSEIWLDGEKAATLEYWKNDIDMKAVQEALRYDNGRGVVFQGKEEPIYGETYLPRKFKVGVTVPGDNSIDIYTQDIGIVVITNPYGLLEGFNLIVGGGMGRTHNKESTFARTGDHLGFVPKDKLIEAVKAIIATQRDHGNREVRANARMKYLVHNLGIEKFRELVETYYGEKFEPYRELAPWQYKDWLGWHAQEDGKYFLGLFIEHGRIKDDGAFRLKSALRELTEKLKIDMVVSPNQNVILKDITPKMRSEVEAVLREHGVKLPEEYSRNRVLSMACPALPLCGLAITEAERVMPATVDRIDALLAKVGLKVDIVMRMTGCPNGCARPYMAELGFVGSGPSSYQIWMGGCPNQTRLAFPVADKVEDGDLEKFLEPVFTLYKNARIGDESFGAFTFRIGKDKILAVTQASTPAGPRAPAATPAAPVAASNGGATPAAAASNGTAVPAGAASAAPKPVAKPAAAAATAAPVAAAAPVATADSNGAAVSAPKQAPPVSVRPRSLKSGTRVRVPIPSHIRAGLEELAKKRGVNVSKLANDIIEEAVSSVVLEEETFNKLVEMAIKRVMTPEKTAASLFSDYLASHDE